MTRHSADVHNPVLALPSVQRLMQLPPDQRQVIADCLRELSEVARDKAEWCWLRHKAPMATYWKSVGVYAKHFGRAVRRG